MNIKNTPKALLDAVSKVLEKATFHVEEEITTSTPVEKEITPVEKESTILENKTVKEVEEPKAKGEKDFKLLHLRDLVLHVAEASSDEVLYEDNMELVKKAAGGSAQKIKVKGGKMTMDSFTASTLMAIMKAVKPSVKKGIEDVINSGDKTKILKLVDLAFKSTGRKEDVNEVDEPEAKGEKDFKDLHVKDLEVYTEKLDPKADAGEWIEDFLKSDAPQFKGKSKEERKKMALAAYYSAREKAGLEEGADKDVKGDKEAYRKFFQGMLKKFGVKSPAELSGDKEKEFYDAIDAGWKADDEKKESIEEMKEPFIVIDTADKNKVVGTASHEKGAESIIASSERPPISIKDKKTLKIVKSNKKQYVGFPMKEETLEESKGVMKVKTHTPAAAQRLFKKLRNKFSDFRQPNSDDMVKGDEVTYPNEPHIKRYIKQQPEVADMMEETLEESKEVVKVKTHTPAAAQRLFKKLRNKFSGFRTPNGDDIVNGDEVTIPNSRPIIRYIEKQPEVVDIVETFEESKSSTGYELYHDTFSGAMQHAYDFAKKKLGVTVDPNEIDKNVALGPKKPSKGKTNSYRLKGKGGAIQVQVYNMDNKKYELNMYKESVE